MKNWSLHIFSLIFLHDERIKCSTLLQFLTTTKLFGRFTASCELHWKSYRCLLSLLLTFRTKINGLRVRVARSQDSHLAGEVKQPESLSTPSRLARAWSPSRFALNLQADCRPRKHLHLKKLFRLSRTKWSTTNNELLWIQQMHPIVSLSNGTSDNFSR